MSAGRRATRLDAGARKRSSGALPGLTMCRPRAHLRPVGGLARAGLALVLLGLVAIASGEAGATPGPGPGEPFGGDDSGCVPPTVERLRCSKRAASALGKLTKTVSACHTRRADARFREVVLGGRAAADDAACESSAQARVAASIASISATSGCAAIGAAAAARAAVLLADAGEPASLDARQAAPYCDPSSGVSIDPGGDDAGTVPASKAGALCAARVARAIAKLAGDVDRCHTKAAERLFARFDPPYDEEMCEESAVARFDRKADRLAATGLCPGCLSFSAQHALAIDTVAWLDAGNGAAFPCPDLVAHPGAIELDRPTLMSLGLRLPLDGDENRNAVATVRYRAIGEPGWRDALPLYRVRPEDVSGYAVAEHFAGSIFDLRPATTYEMELRVTDDDGPLDTTLSTVATTRGVPSDPTAPRVVPVGDTGELVAALAAAAPGDVISLADGLYGGPFVLSASGTAGEPIVVRGASRDGTVLEGGGCGSCNVLEVYGSFVHVERLTLRSGLRALRFQTAGAEGNVVRRVRAHDVTLGFASRAGQRDFYVCDNDLEGRLVWPETYADDGGVHSDDDGIRVEGSGHVVCHNRVTGFGDALKNAETGARALDFYGNEVLSAYDNGIELDGGAGNVRALRNRFTNTYATISFQPIYGGPAYAIRNVVVNVAHEQLKLHGLANGREPSGILIYHNTFVSPEIALRLETSATTRHFEVVGNLFVGPAALAGPRAVDWTGPIEDGRFDYDGYFPSGPFRFHLPPAGLVSFVDLAALQASGIEPHGVALAEPIFASGLVAPASYATTVAPGDVTLAGTGAAVDRGAVLPNVTDGFVGVAPDLGALERGCPAPIFGVRPEGVDETNEPLGCSP
jgi:hypothetical protein